MPESSEGKGKCVYMFKWEKEKHPSYNGISRKGKKFGGRYIESYRHLISGSLKKMGVNCL